MDRLSGILLPVFSLPSKYGIGCFSKDAYEFVDWLKEAGQSLWQVLPHGPTGFGDSPYQAFSAFAGNPYFIGLDALIEEGLLDKDDVEIVKESCIDYERLYNTRFSTLKKAYARWDETHDEKFLRFKEENDYWLADYALFMACKEHFGGKEFTKWEKDIRNRTEAGMNWCREYLLEEAKFWEFVQYKFFSQWEKLKRYANSKGIKIIGDIPIYTAPDSCDVWANRNLFDVDEDGVPRMVAGCPPDGFSENGQLWGNPVYRWQEHKKTGYTWWVQRLSFCFCMYDILRIDHFRGFDEFYQIPYGEETAKNGVWKKGPGKEVFDAFEKACGKQEIIAEDLGFITDSVKKLVSDCGFCSTKVLQFAFDSRDGGGSAYLPHNYQYNSAAYTGTHDNSTITGWLEAITNKEQELVRGYLCNQCTPCGGLNLPLISLVLVSGAKYSIIPLQDWLGLDDSARINTPSTSGNNWIWRAEKSYFSPQVAKMIKETTKRYGRS